MPAVEQLVPVLVYANIEAAHDFLVRAFGFESGGIERGADGTPVHAEVRAGNSRVWLHRVDPKNKLISAASSDTAAFGVYVQVDDVDAHCAHAQANGAEVEGTPQDRPYGVREYGSRDIEGHRWWFGSPVGK